MTSAYRAACAPVGVFDAFAFEPNAETISNARSPPIVIIRATRRFTGVVSVSVSVFRPAFFSVSLRRLARRPLR